MLKTVPIPRTRKSTMRRRALPLALITVISCGEQPAPTSHQALHGSTLVLRAADIEQGLVAEVHAATAKFHSTAQASKAGYVEDSPCVAHPTLGTMGFHWVNHGLVDPVFNPLAPEALVYAPDKHGNLKLVALEYIVINVGQPRPAFAGHLFDIGGTPAPVAHWTVHVWTHEANPSGIHAPFNPAVSCTS